MSAADTPRTDAQLLVPYTDGHLRKPDGSCIPQDVYYVPADFARQLERELAAVNAYFATLQRNYYLSDEEKIGLRAELAETRIKLHNMTELYNGASKELAALRARTSP